MKTIIYYRKSTDRDDKQANSLEHQLGNCLRVAEKYDLEIINKIGESKSAKTEWTRPWFNELVKICKTWKIDYIIIDEPKRLSRNNLDTSRIIDLMDKKQIKWILSTSREYLTEHSRDKFLLQLDLSLSKMDNEDRSKDVKDKMSSFVNNKKRFPWKAPFWYKNITIKKWVKDIIIDKKQAKIVREIFDLRLENKAFSTICNILISKYWKIEWLNLSPNRIHQLVGKTFYYWLFQWWWQEIIWNHKPLISRMDYLNANNIKKWVYEQKENTKTVRKYRLKWLIRDTSGIYLTSYSKKEVIYYWNQYRSNIKVCINEDSLFNKIGEYIKQNDFTNEKLKSLDKDIILDLLKQEELNNWSEYLNIDNEIEKLKEKQDKLLDLKLDDVINQEMYKSKNNKIVNEIKTLLDRKKSIKNYDFEKKTQIMLELAGSFYSSYFRWDYELKTEIIKKLMLELSIGNKKELQIEESPLFKSSKMLNFSFGTPNENWTRVSTVRGSRPSH